MADIDLASEGCNAMSEQYYSVWIRWSSGGAWTNNYYPDNDIGYQQDRQHPFPLTKEEAIEWREQTNNAECYEIRPIEPNPTMEQRQRFLVLMSGKSIMAKKLKREDEQRRLEHAMKFL